MSIKIHEQQEEEGYQRLGKQISGVGAPDKKRLRLPQKRRGKWEGSV